MINPQFHQQIKDTPRLSRRGETLVLPNILMTLTTDLVGSHPIPLHKIHSSSCFLLTMAVAHWPTVLSYPQASHLPCALAVDFTRVPNSKKKPIAIFGVRVYNPKLITQFELDLHVKSQILQYEVGNLSQDNTR